MATIRLTTLGGFGLNVNGVPTPGPATRKARALMAFLVMNRHADTARERLLETFWPDAAPERARQNLSTALWSIRRCLRTAGLQADKCLAATHSMVRWTGLTDVDAQHFAELVARHDAVASREALELYRGDFLEGDYDNWAVAERERLAALYEAVLSQVIRTSKDTEAAQRLIARNPYDEEAYATLIAADLAAGRRSSAAHWADRCRKALSEVGEKPSAAFETQFGSIAYFEPLVTDELTLPFAGRAAELALLSARYNDAKTGGGSVTLVHGEAGIGKSALLNRAARIAEEHGLRVLRIRCGESPSTFGPWQRVFESVETASFDTFIRTHSSDLSAAVAHAIAARLPAPTAIIVDDAHELAAEGLDILVALARTAISRHAVTIGLRPEGVSLFRSRFGKVPFEELPIGRLERGTLAWALAQALGSDQPKVFEALYDRTEGHPLFFVGLLNSLVTAGALARDGHMWQLTKPVDADVELPATLKRYIEAQLRSGGDAAHAVACALALEPTANADDLTAVLGLDESTVLDAFDDLLALGLIIQPVEGPQFAFSHDLIREVAALGLNAARRRALHRSFAQRLQISDEVEGSLRLARHLRAAGEHVLAAQSYLRSAQQALELNAAQDAMDRCEAGIQEADGLERSAASAVLLARLQRTAARAAIASGDVRGAIVRAREAVAFARAAGDFHESTQALLELAVMEGAAFRIPEQKSDAAEAVEHARRRADESLEAQALVQQASAARELGLREEALRTAYLAHNTATKCRRPDVALAALEELLRAQMAWWLFDDALETARIGLEAARRAEPLAEASFLQARCALWYLLERFDEAQSDLDETMQLTNDAITRRQTGFGSPIQPLPLLQFATHHMGGKIAIASREWDKAVLAAERLAALTSIARLPRYGEALRLHHIDALLQRNASGDNETAHVLTASLGEPTAAEGTLRWSDCVELARARDAARRQVPEANDLLRRALNSVEENAHRALLEADRAFARLADAASEVGEVPIASQARARSEYYWSRRRAAAGAAWGGKFILAIDRH